MSIRINENQMLSSLLTRTRRSVRLLADATRRVAAGEQLQSASDDPGAIGQVVFNGNAIRGISAELRSLNEGISVAQQADSYLRELEEVLYEMRWRLMEL